MSKYFCNECHDEVTPNQPSCECGCKKAYVADNPRREQKIMTYPEIEKWIRQIYGSYYGGGGWFSSDKEAKKWASEQELEYVLVKYPMRKKDNWLLVYPKREGLKGEAQARKKLEKMLKQKLHDPHARYIPARWTTDSNILKPEDLPMYVEDLDEETYGQIKNYLRNMGTGILVNPRAIRFHPARAGSSGKYRGAETTKDYHTVSGYRKRYPKVDKKR